MDQVTSAVIDFWFGDTDEPRGIWFKSSAETDREIAARFASVLSDAAAGVFDDQAATADDYLAVIVVFDQFPRNMHRGTPDAFAHDAIARDWARRAIDLGFDQMHASIHRRLFMYLPFEHSEDLADQDRAVALTSMLGDDNYTRFAEAHRDVIRLFGRFPHRNAILGRASTPEEVEYLKTNKGF